MVTNQTLLDQIEFLIKKGNGVLATKRYSQYSSDVVDNGLFVGFRSSCLSYISRLYSEKHPFYLEFDKEVKQNYAFHVESGLNLLNSIKSEVEQGWLVTFKHLVTAELFSDFLEMSKYLLDEKYKDPAAVMIGSVLEEHLRQLCIAHNIDTTTIRAGTPVPKKADLLNSDLVKGGVYGGLEQKSVTAWLDLRNKAAHGRYSEYVIGQVELMYQGVLDFITRIK